MLLANRAVAVSFVPLHHTFFAELMATDSQDAGFERGLADDTDTRFVGLGTSFLEVEHCDVLANFPRESNDGYLQYLCLDSEDASLRANSSSVLTILATASSVFGPSYGRTLSETVCSCR